MRVAREERSAKNLIFRARPGSPVLQAMYLFILFNKETVKRTFLLFVNSISSTKDPLTKSMVGTMISEKFISGGMSGIAVLAIQFTHFTCNT